MDAHAERVRKMAAAVKAFHKTKQRFRIDHGSTNSTRNQSTKGKNVINTSKMDHVLSVDAKTMTILVEPNVPMDRLIEASLAQNLIPPLVIDFPGISCGGGYAGTTCESSSFKHGFFSETVNSIEMVLANGEVVICSKTEREDLFRGSAGAMGSLGVLTMLEIQLVHAKKYVETTYHPVISFDEAVTKCRAMSTETSPYEYVDGILFTPTSGAVITGRCTNDRPSNVPVQRFSASTDPWFYSHVQNRIGQSKDPVTDLIPLPEYLFRYDRGAFWVGESIFAGEKHAGGIIPNTKRTKKWLDPLLHTRMLYAAVHAGGFNGQIIQDMVVPYDKAVEFLDWVAAEVEVWPLWLCPVQPSANPTLHPHQTPIQSEGPQPQMLNIGVWGAAKILDFEYWIDVNQRLEARLRESGGMKWMYGVNLEDDEEFWGQHERGWYEELRRKYDADWVPSIADKARTTREKCVEQMGNVPWKDSFLFNVFPGFTATVLWRAWRSGVWKDDRAKRWQDWVPREK